MVSVLEDTSKVEALFEGWEETLIWSCIQKVMGKVFVTDLASPVSAMAYVGCFAFYAGEPDRELVQEMQAGVIFSMRYLGRKKRAFISGFMADKATAVYEDRMAAAEMLWKLVKRYMEKESFFSRFKLEYNRDWLETYEEKLTGFKREEVEEVHPSKRMPANMEELASMAGEIGFEVRTVDNGSQKTYLEVSRQDAPSSDMVVELLGLLTYEYVLDFFDSFYWSPTDPGRYVSVYMTEGSPVYHFGNHGWSSDYKYLSCSEMADLIVKNWDKSDGSNYKNYIMISTNLWSTRDKDKYYMVISRKG